MSGGEPAAAGAHRSARALDGAGIAWMAGITLVWGLNAVAVKVVTAGVAPVMGAALRSLLALALLTAYARWRREALPWRGPAALHAAVVGLLFGLEFILVYVGGSLTTGGHLAIFLNTAPVFVAIGAHFLLAGDRLTPLRVAGLVTAFAGIALLFADRAGGWETAHWRGDLLVLGAAALWASETLYIKRFLVGRATPFAILYYQTLVSAPLLLGASGLFESDRFAAFSRLTLAVLLFQGGFVVVFSYLMWMVLLQRYAASALQSLTLLAPAWGVALGVLLLGERFTSPLAAGLALVLLGLYGLNRRHAIPAG